MPFTMPTVFLSHGAPTLALEEEATSQFIRQLAANLPTPRTIVMVSAHWETAIPMITGSANPQTIHDFQGFPAALYALRYTAPGDPALATEIRNLLAAANIECSIDPNRGLDHGAWNPLILGYPEATIPVIQLSVQQGKDANWHYKVGQALAPLRQKNILIIGSGNLTHNLREAMRGNHEQTPSWVTAFATWVADCASRGDIQSLLDWQTLAPYARENHPTPEHFLPFFVALGAAGTPLYATRLHEDVTYGVLAMDAYAFTNAA